MKSAEVCVDASLAIKVVVPETGSDKADALFDRWAGEEVQLIAPVFFEVETDSILRQKASLRRELTADQAQRAFASLRALPIMLTSIASLGRFAPVHAGIGSFTGGELAQSYFRGRRCFTGVRFLSKSLYRVRSI